MSAQYLVNQWLDSYQIFGQVFEKNPSSKIAMSGRAGGRLGVGHWASSEVYLLVNLFEKPVHSAFRRFSCHGYIIGT